VLGTEDRFLLKLHAYIKRSGELQEVRGSEPCWMAHSVMLLTDPENAIGEKLRVAYSSSISRTLLVFFICSCSRSPTTKNSPSPSNWWWIPASIYEIMGTNSSHCGRPIFSTSSWVSGEAIFVGSRKEVTESVCRESLHDYARRGRSVHWFAQIWHHRTSLREANHIMVQSTIQEE
jgi:hypothetical protein